MKRKFCGLAVVALLLTLLPGPLYAADDLASSIKMQEGYTLSLDLKFSRKKQNALQQVVSFLDYGVNGYATGFIVGDGLVMTAYHVVSGNLSPGKKVQLGFGAYDELEVQVYTKGGCEATVLRVDEDADLALLRVCSSRKQNKALAFQTNLNKDEKLFLIGKPRGNKIVRRGLFHGAYSLRGLEYWSANIEGRDGLSGSPVYNARAELVGVYCSFDGAKKLAVISPGSRAQKLLADYIANAQPRI